MSRINQIQMAIKELDAASFQKLMDAYLYRKYGFSNIQTLGVQEGTNKTTPGTPDSFVLDQDGKYILLMYGSWQTREYQKLKQDIMSCFEKRKLDLGKGKIKKIICAHISTNIHPEQVEELRELVPEIEIEIIGVDTISHDLLFRFRDLSTEFLNIPIDTHQIFSIDRFIEEYDKNRTNAPIDMPFHFRETETEALYRSINTSKLTLVTGEPGVGKTRLVLEVCKKFEVEGWQVLCIKSNGAELYEDVQMHISDEGNCLLFIDDANQITQLNFILDYIITLSETRAVHIVMTVRDYAKKRVKDLVCNFMIPQEIQINSLTGDNVKKILKENFRIKNEYYLEKIVQIAKGNARLAILAGKISIDRGYSALTNSENIFAQYYENIMNEAGLTTTDIGVLFVVSFFGSFRYKGNQVLQKILEAMNIDLESFMASCQELHNKELIDLYLNEAAKISDQSFGNYILEYVLTEKKMFSISQLLAIVFPQYTNKVVYLINTLQKLFYSDELEKYLKEQINISWERASEDQQNSYLETFFAFNEEKALAELSKIIDHSENMEMDVLSLDIEKHKNHNSISNKTIAVLSNFKHSKYFEDAIELMLRFYKKRPDLVMDFYFAFTHRMSFDSTSRRYDYEKEYKLVETLWKYSNVGEDANITVLLIHILGEMLDCKFNGIELGENGRSFTFSQYQVFYTEGSRKIRHLIWKILSEIYTKDVYKGLVENIITNNHVGGLDKEEAKNFFQFDMQYIQELFFDKWRNLSFWECKILREVELQAKRLGVENEDLFHRYNTNEDFMIYNMLTREFSGDQTYKTYEEERKRQIEETILTYAEEDYKKLFQVCWHCEENNDKNNWLLKSGLVIVFETAEENPEQYYNLVNLYLQCQAPFSGNADKIVGTLFKNFRFEEIKRLIEEKDFIYKRKWMSAFWEMAPEEMLNPERTKEFLEFIKCEAALSEPEFPEVGCLLRYRANDPDIVKKVSETILKNPPENRLYIAEFLGFAISDDVIEAMMSLYENELNLLEKLYCLACEARGVYFDSAGKLISKLVNVSEVFWDTYTKMLHGNMHMLSNEHTVFNYIWGLDTYDELINTAYKNMVGDYFSFMVEEEAKAIFANSKESSEYLRQRKKDWIKTYIKSNLDNENNLKEIFGIIASFFKDDSKEFILELLSNKKDIEMFQAIPLFANFETWTGSEVPLIEEKIDFLNDLISSLEGVDFINHRAYLRKKIGDYEAYKQEILLRDYLENSDIA